MAHEIETKVLGIDAAKVRAALDALGANAVRDTRLTVDWYRVQGTKPGEDPWFLRIRSDAAGKHEVTWKAKSNVIGVARKHKEINFNIEDPAAMRDLFEELGLEAYAHQEKDRVSYDYRDWHFDIDTYPGIPPYLEIEGTSDEHVREGMRILGLESSDTWAEGERTLIEGIYKTDWYDMRF